MLMITFYVTEKKVGDALWALEGIAQGKPEVTLIRGAKATANGGIKTTLRTGSVTEEVAKLLRESGLAHIRHKDIASYIVKAGGSKKSTGSIGSALRKAGVLGKGVKGLGLPILGAK